MGSSRAVLGVMTLVVIVFAGVPTCAEDYRSRLDSITYGLGNAPAHNIAVHTVNPWPASSRNPRIHMDGERALLAADRYKLNRSIPPRGLTTQTINVQGSTPGIAPR
jgi:hypothetical protein